MKIPNFFKYKIEVEEVKKLMIEAYELGFRDCLKEKERKGHK